MRIEASAADFERQMAIAREVMDRDWIVLSALALGDRHPELDAEALVEMAKKQGRGPTAKS